jgi:hypothetical protein
MHSRVFAESNQLAALQPLSGSFAVAAGDCLDTLVKTYYCE